MSKFSKLPRLFTSSSLEAGNTLELSSAQSHYLKNVLRLKEQDQLRAFNGQDGEWLLSLQEISKKSVTATCEKQLRAQKSSDTKVHLYFAPIKKTRLDFLIEKTVELGVTDLHPVLTERTEVRKINPERIDTQIIEAAEQCERLDIPKIHSTIALYDIPNTQKLYAAIERDETTPDIHTLHFDTPVQALIGPEGGFSEKEINFLKKQTHIIPVSLGQNILRAETAAVKFLSCISAT